MANPRAHFNIVDIGVTLISLITFVFDVSTDILVCIQLLIDDQRIWGSLMIVFISVPAILMSVFSLIWHIHDKTVTPGILASHLLLAAPAQRYVNVIRLGVNSYKSRKVVFTQRALIAQSDVSILRLIEAFLEAAPQLVMQLYLLVYHKSGDWFTGVSAASSLISMTWAMTAYCDSQRRAHSANYQRRLIRLILHWGWQVFMAAGRIAAFVFFACALHGWLFALMGGHWLIAFIWISMRGTDFGSGVCEKWMFRLVCGFIYIFVFLNLNDGSSRWRLTAYYILVLVENAAMVVVYLVLGDSANMILVSCSVVFGGYFLGLFCMLIYYMFLHPSGSAKELSRCLRLKDRTLNGSSSLTRADPQIFSIESPKTVTMMSGTGIDLSQNASSSYNSAVATQQTWVFNQSSGSSHSAERPPSLLKQTLQLAWQNGMESSSDSSSTSSLASTENRIGFEKRTPSVKSEASHNSASSNNHLLPPKVKRNDLSRSPKKSARTDGKNLEHLKKELSGEITESDNLNIHSSGSKSPTLSRSSWARSSDHNRQSLVLEDFTVLGFDDSSSVDRRNSDCSSFNSQLRSLSPLNASGMWKDLNGRLRATIAATVAAATGNPSSNEGTPYRNRSVSSYGSTASVYEDSLNSLHNNTSSVNHNTAFMDSGSSYKDKADGSQETLSQREAVSSLPNIVEVLEQNSILGSGVINKSFEICAEEAAGDSDLVNECDANKKTPVSHSPAAFSTESSSPFPHDSTLTASKLETKRSTSYLASQKRHRNQNLNVSELLNSPVDLSFRSPQSNKTAQPLHQEDEEEKSHHGDSPFTDQELVSVMAKSLQSYVGTSCSGSQNPEREGLALTLDDLRISRETTPSHSPLSKTGDDSWKSRSASSLFHDSPESSPVSSASKMNQGVSIAEAEAKLSPNALRQLDVPPENMENLGLGLTLHDAEGRTLATIPPSLALKFIVESYGSTASRSPHTPFSQKSSHRTPSQPHISKPGSERITPQPFIHNYKAKSSLQSSQSHGRIRGAKLSEVFVNPTEVTSHTDQSTFHPHEQSASVSKSSHSRSRHPAGSPKATTSPKQSQPRGGVSTTKKLNVHFGDFPLMKYDSSPFQFQNRPRPQDLESDSGSEIGGYVAGQYCPPLCVSNDTDGEENSIQRNLDRERRRNSYDLDSVEKSVLHHSPEDNHVYKQMEIDGNEQLLSSVRKQIIIRDAELRKQKSDFFHLNQREPYSPKKKYPTSKSQPNLHSQPLRHKSGEGSKELSVHRARGKIKSDKGQNHSVHEISMSGNRSFSTAMDMQELCEDELYLSAQHVADYFSEALESKSNNPFYRQHPHKDQTSSKRLPLQRLDNSQRVSPDVGSHGQYDQQRDRRFNSSVVVLSPNECDFSGLSSDKHRFPDAADWPKQKLMFDSFSDSKIDESAASDKLFTRPPSNKHVKSTSKSHSSRLTSDD